MEEDRARRRVAGHPRAVLCAFAVLDQIAERRQIRNEAVPFGIFVLRSRGRLGVGNRGLRLTSNATFGLLVRRVARFLPLGTPEGTQKGGRCRPRVFWARRSFSLWRR